MKLPHTRNTLAVTFSLLAMAASTSAQDGNLIAYEGFDYELSTSVDFKSGGSGWSGSWTWRNAFDGKGTIITDSGFIEGGLNYGDLETIGNSMHMYGDFGTLELARRFAEVIPGTAGTHTYISLIGQRVGPAANPDDPIYDNPDTPEVEPYPYGDNLYPRGAAVRFFNSSNGEVFQIGNFSNQDTNEWSIFAEGRHSSGVPFTDYAFVVVRIDHLGDELVADNIYMWVNPDLSAGENLGAAQVAVEGITDNDGVPVNFSNLAWISPWVGNGDNFRPYAEMLLDEFRVGTTWAAVTPTGGTTVPKWGPFVILSDIYVDTGSFLGWIDISGGDWVWNLATNKYIFLPEEYFQASSGAWIFMPNTEAAAGGDTGWAGFTIAAENYVNTGSFLGWINISGGDWIWNLTFNKYMYLPEGFVSASGAWIYVPYAG